MDNSTKTIEELEAECKELKRENLKLRCQLSGHQFCPDCRDKVAHEDCLRCQRDALRNKLRNIMPERLMMALEEAITDECWCSPQTWTCVRCMWERWKSAIQKY